MFPGNFKVGQQSLGTCCDPGSMARDKVVPPQGIYIVLPGPMVGQTKGTNGQRNCQGFDRKGQSHRL